MELIKLIKYALVLQIAVTITWVFFGFYWVWRHYNAREYETAMRFGRPLERSES